MKHSPCHDPKTKTDCPKRKLGCRTNCEQWQKYEQANRKKYSENLAKTNANFDYVTVAYSAYRREQKRNKK